MAKDDPRLPLLEKQQEDLYREAVQRSGRPWKTIAGRAIKRPKTFKNDSSSSSAPFMPTSAGWTSTHSPLTKAQASPECTPTSKVSGFEGCEFGLSLAKCFVAPSLKSAVGGICREPCGTSRRAVYAANHAAQAVATAPEDLD